jgi:hypothetical protein
MMRGDLSLASGERGDLARRCCEKSEESATPRNDDARAVKTNAFESKQR